MENRLRTEVRADGIGREMGADIENPIPSHVIWYRYRITEILKQLGECALEFSRWRPILVVQRRN